MWRRRIGDGGELGKRTIALDAVSEGAVTHGWGYATIRAAQGFLANPAFGASDWMDRLPRVSFATDPYSISRGEV